MTGHLRAGTPLPSPLYKEVTRLIRDALLASEWKPGEAIPAERLLAERYGVAIGTVRKAIDELAQENILVRQQGRGTFVAIHNRERLRFQFFHIVRHDGVKILPGVRLISFGRGRADEEEAARLQIPRNTAVFRIGNLLSIDGEPVIFDHISMPQSLFAGLTEAQFAGRPDTIYHLYQTAFGITVARSAERLRAVLADAGAAAHLRIEAGAPLLEIRRVAMTIGDTPVEYRRSLVNTARHEYLSELRGT